MNTNPSKKYLDQVTDYLLRQNPNLKGPILIPRELIEAAERGELPEAPAPSRTSSQQPRRNGQTILIRAPSLLNDPANRIGGRRAPESDGGHAQPKRKQTPDNSWPTKQGRGRPAYLPPWLEPAAQLVANGYTLRKALWRLGVRIPEAQLRQVYRWRLFWEYYEEARARFVAEWGSTPPRKVESFTRGILGQWENLGG